MKKLLFLASLFFLFSCGSTKYISDNDIIEEIKATEKAFEQMCEEKGIPEAFAWYAAENATIKRENDTLISGREYIRDYYKKTTAKNTKVLWSPDYVEVAKSRDMAYSYGKYLWLVSDKNGQEQKYTGVYITIWKKQPDGSWKYVWD